MAVVRQAVMVVWMKMVVMGRRDTTDHVCSFGCVGASWVLT